MASIREAAKLAGAAEIRRLLVMAEDDDLIGGKNVDEVDVNDMAGEIVDTTMLIVIEALRDHAKMHWTGGLRNSPHWASIAADFLAGREERNPVLHIYMKGDVITFYDREQFPQGGKRFVVDNIVPSSTHEGAYDVQVSPQPGE